MVDNDRVQALIKAFFEDHDHGREAMQSASVTENICFIDYLEHTCIKKAKELDNEKDLQYFTEYDIHFRMLTLEKIMRLEQFWIVISKATNHFYSFNKDAIVLVDYSEADFLVNSLAKQNFDVEIRKISNPEFVAMVEDMPRIGFKNVQFTDGRLTPLIVPRDTILKGNEVKTTTNPDLYMESLIFLQEAHRFSKDKKGVVISPDSPVTKAVREANFLVPAIVENRNEHQMKIKYPFLNTNVKGQKILPVLTDRKEYEYFVKSPVMKEYNALPKDKKVCVELPFIEIYRVFETDNLFGVAVNPVGFNFVINQEIFAVMAKGITLTNNPDVLVERNGEEVVFPEEPQKKRYNDEETSDLRRKVLEHFIQVQQGIIDKNTGVLTDEAIAKVKKAEGKLAEFKKQLQELDSDD